MTREEMELRVESPLESVEKSAAMRRELHQQSIAEAAYYKAEKRGFVPGLEEQDWAEAERDALSDRTDAVKPVSAPLVGVTH